MNGLEDPEPLPVAHVERVTATWRRPGLYFYWLLPMVCLFVAAAVWSWAYLDRGPQIVIDFQQGHGLKPGDRLRHRGIEVGEVMSVRLSSDFDTVQVRVQLDPSASGLAREGSLFWIERPQLSLTRMRGLDTVVGANYLEVLPGSPEAPARYRFKGEEHPLSVQGTRLREIRIRFRHGNGLIVGDPLRHRGIEVGEVVGVSLAPDLSLVEVRVRLQERASRLARMGTQFWIERPRLSLAGVRGLETVVRGRYLAVRPGPPQAAPADLFDGIELAPVAEAGGLEVVLESADRLGVEVGAPVTYRGIRIGSITAVHLAADATQVESYALIEPDYRSLVFSKTRFWSTGGIGIDVGFSGFELNAETLQTIAAGGVALATPDEPGDPVSDGHRFQLIKNADPQWLEWSPRLPSGPTRLPDGSRLPEPQRVTLHWQIKQLGFRRDQVQSGLALLLADGQWLALKDLFSSPADALPNSTWLQFPGGRHEVVADRCRIDGSLAYYDLPTGVHPTAPPWPNDRIREAGAPEDCLIVVGGGARVIPLPARRMSRQHRGRWLIDSNFQVVPQWHGANTVAASDGQLVGILAADSESERGRVLLVKPE